MAAHLTHGPCPSGVAKPPGGGLKNLDISAVSDGFGRSQLTLNFKACRAVEYVFAFLDCFGTFWALDLILEMTGGDKY